MLTEREIKVVEVLLDESPNPLTSEFLSALMGVSSRTIKEDINNIDDFLKAYKFNVHRKRGIGYWFESSSVNEIKEIVNKEVINTARKDLENEIVKKLLFRENFVSIEWLSQKLYFSTSEIFRAIKSVNKELSKYKLKIISKVYKGVKLLGSEKQQRLYYAQFLKNKYFFSSNYLNIEEIQSHFPNENVAEIIAIIFEFKRKTNIYLTDIAIRALLIHIIISINRIRTNAQIEMTSEELKELKRNTEWKYAEYLAYLLSEAFNVSMTDTEIGFISINLLAANIHNESSDKNVNEDVIYLKLCQWAKEIDKKYNMGLYNDKIFLKNLSFHLKPMIKRIEYGITILNPWLNELKSKEARSFELAVSLGEFLNKTDKNNIKEDELAYVAMHIATALERQKSGVKVAIVCPTGVGTSNFLKSRLKFKFPNLKITRTLSIYDDLENIEENILISTIPLEIKGKRIIYVSPLLGIKDQEKIDYQIKKESNPKSLCNYFYPQLLHSKIVLKNKDDVIKLASDSLIKEGFVAKDFKKGIFDREKISSTEIGKLVAIPHTIHGKIYKSAIDVIILKDPVDWGKEKVQIIFTLALKEEDYKDYPKFFSELVNMMNNSTICNELLRINKFTELIKLIKNRKRR